MHPIAFLPSFLETKRVVAAPQNGSSTVAGTGRCQPVHMVWVATSLAERHGNTGAGGRPAGRDGRREGVLLGMAVYKGSPSCVVTLVLRGAFNHPLPGCPGQAGHAPWADEPALMQRSTRAEGKVALVHPYIGLRGESPDRAQMPARRRPLIGAERAGVPSGSLACVLSYLVWNAEG